MENSPPLEVKTCPKACFSSFGGKSQNVVHNYESGQAIFLPKRVVSCGVNHLLWCVLPEGKPHDGVVVTNCSKVKYQTRILRLQVLGKHNVNK